TIKACGYAISKKGGYGGYLGKDVGSIDEAIRLIDDLNKKGVDYIKVINSGIVDLETGEITAGGFEAGELKDLVSHAGALGLDVFCHANGDNAIRDAIVAGAKAIIHGFMISDDSIGMMKENNVIFIPTIAALSRLKDILESDEAVTIINRLVEDHLAAIKKAYDMGVKVLPGSDSGSRSLPYGLTFLEELNLFHKAGLNIEEVLSVAVAGTIQIGQQADLVAIEGPPFEKGEILIAGRYR
ncbi:MAG: amidohydrolase family protein, partial [Nitrospirota bacterium]